MHILQVLLTTIGAQVFYLSKPKRREWRSAKFLSFIRAVSGLNLEEALDEIPPYFMISNYN